MEQGRAGRKRAPPEVRRAIQQSREGVRTLAARYGLDPKTVRRWRGRGSAESRKPGPKQARSTVLGLHQEAVVVAIRGLTLLPLDDCFYALRTFLPRLTRASLHRCLRRHGVSRLPSAALRAARPGGFDLHLLRFGDERRPFCLMIAVEHASRYMFADIYAAEPAAAAGAFLEALAGAAPVPVRSVLAPQGGPLAELKGELGRACRAIGAVHSSIAPRWPPDRLASLEALMREASDARAAEFDLAQMRARLAAFMTHYNQACRLKALGGATPSAYLAREAAAMPSRPADAAGCERLRDPERTREAILQAARGLVARLGPDGFSLSEAARIAGVNRGTAYQHFKSREQLIAATAEWGAEQLRQAVFGAGVGRRVGEQAHITRVAEHLAEFAMHNPEMCQAWLFQFLASREPAKDPFWREYYGAAMRFHASPRAQDDIDTEVFAIVILAGTFLWPIWARTQAASEVELPRFAERFVREALRLSTFGAIRPECFPGLVARLQSSRPGEGP